MNGEHATDAPTTALEVVPPQRIPIEHDVELLGRAMVSSGYFKDTRTASQAMVRILAGKEIGLPPIASMTGIHIIDGKVTLGANLIAAVIKRSGRYTYRIREHSDQCCRIEFYEDRESVGISEFTLADAQRAGLAGKGIWRTYPRNMLFARALTNGARWYCADVFGGAVYTEEELGHDAYVSADIVQSAQTANQTPAPVPTPTVQPAEPAPAPVLDWDGQPDSPVTLDPALSDDLDAAFRAQAATNLVAPATRNVAERFANDSKGQAAFLAECKGKLGLEPDDMQVALGGKVSAYMKATGKTLDEVYAVLQAKVDDNVAVPGRLGATE